MNSRERVITALRHEEPDRVPIDLGGTAVSSIAISTYAALRDRLGLPRRDIRVLETVQQIAVVDDDAMDLLGVDVVPVFANPPDDVRAEVIRRLRDLAPGGGFVFNPVHNIQPNVPPENIAAMFETARESGRYPIRA